MRLRTILCGMLALAMAVGCKEEIPFEPKLNVSRTAAEISAEGGAITVEVTSNAAWSAETDSDWITAISPSQGTASEDAVTVTIEAAEYDGTEDRTATITFNAGDLDKTLTITQTGKAAEDPSDNPATGTDSELFVAWTSSSLLKDINKDASNPNCFYQKDNDTAEGYSTCALGATLGTGAIKYWSVDKSGFDTDKMRRHIGNHGEPMAYGNWTGDHFLFEATYDLPANSNVSISFGMWGKKTTLKYWLLEYKDGNTWKPAGETETLGDIVYNAVCGIEEAPATINASVVLANATDKVQFRLVCAAPVSIQGNTLSQPANDSYTRIDPNTPIIIKGGAITDENKNDIIVPAFSIDKTELPVDVEGGNETVALTSNMPWTATSDSDWASVLPISGDASETPVNATVIVSANGTESPRSSTLTFAAVYGNVTFTKTVAVSQEGKEPEPVEGTDCDLMVAWAFSADMKPQNQATWHQSFASGAKMQDLAEGYSDRYLASTIGNGNIRYYQTDKSAFAGGSDNNKIYRHTGNSGEPMAYGTWKGDWFLFEAESQNAIPANSNISISFGLYGNKDTSLKHWLLEYLDGEIWKPAIATTVSGDFTYNVESSVEATPASVNATVILSQSTSKVSFRLVCASTVTLNGTAQTAPVENKWVRINPNRPVIIKGSAITDSDISSIIAPTLTLDKEAAPAEAAGANISLGVTSNMDWTAASDSDWTTVTPASGTASASASSLAVAVEENTSAEERTAKVTVTATYGNATVSKTLTITQAGKTEGETPEPEPEQFSLNTVWDLDTATDDFAESEGAYKEAGDHGKYINATTGSGKLTYVQVDKTELAGNKIYRKYGTGDVMAYGAWEGDYFLFTADSETDIPANTKVSISFHIKGSNKNALRDWTLEYYDNGCWNTAIEKFTMTSAAQEAAATVTMTNAGKTAQFRLRCTSTININGDTVTSAPTVAARIIRDNDITIKSVN